MLEDKMNGWIGGKQSAENVLKNIAKKERAKKEGTTHRETESAGKKNLQRKAQAEGKDAGRRLAAQQSAHGYNRRKKSSN
jgi:hypothetical protein